MTIETDLFGALLKSQEALRAAEDFAVSVLPLLRTATDLPGGVAEAVAILKEHKRHQPSCRSKIGE